MDFQEKAKIRMQRWLEHNEGHLVSYEQFADQLDSAGMGTSAGYIREMIAWAAKSNDCLRKALDEL